MKLYEVIVVKKKMKFTPAELFTVILAEAQRLGLIKKDIFDQKLVLNSCVAVKYENYSFKQITSIHFDFRCVPVFGQNEGIVIDCYLSGQPFKDDINRSNFYHVGTIKTLQSDIEAMRSCGELSGVLIGVAYSFIEKNLHCFEE